jgi:hypothetical protein
MSHIFYLQNFCSIIAISGNSKRLEEAKQDLKWKQAMLEDLAALEKNNTWDLVPFQWARRWLVANGYIQ